MQVLTYDELIDIRASRGVVKDYKTSDNTKLQEPISDYRILLDMAINDPVLFTAVDLTADVVTYNGIKFIGEDKTLIEEAEKRFEEELDFDQVIRNIIWQLVIYGDAFIEKVRDKSGKVEEIHPLETTLMVIKHDEHGEIDKFLMKPNYQTKKESEMIEFLPEDIVYFRLYWIGSRVYSYSPFQPIVKGYNSKLYANHFLEGLFRNLHPKLIYFLKGANKEQREIFMQNLIRAKTNPALDLVGMGEGTAQILQYAFESGLLEILEYLRSEVLMITRVPKMWIGVTDGANRSTAEASVIPFETRVKKIQQIIQSYINKSLMKDLGYEKLTFKFNPISLMDEKSILGNAQVMSTLSLEAESKDPIVYYLQNKGMQIPFDTKRIVMAQETQIQSDGAPSRQRENKKTDMMDTAINKKGVSEAGAEKLEGNKMKMGVA